MISWGWVSHSPTSSRLGSPGWVTLDLCLAAHGGRLLNEALETVAGNALQVHLNFNELATDSFQSSCVSNYSHISSSYDQQRFDLRHIDLVAVGWYFQWLWKKMGKSLISTLPSLPQSNTCAMSCHDLTKKSCRAAELDISRIFFIVMFDWRVSMEF